MENLLSVFLYPYNAPTLLRGDDTIFDSSVILVCVTGLWRARSDEKADICSFDLLK